jgi:hypothetical protein
LQQSTPSITKNVINYRLSLRGESLKLKIMTNIKNIITLFFFFSITFVFAQGMESVTFSSVSSSNDNFQPIAGTPYGANMNATNGSLEISASYGQGTYTASSLSAEELQIINSITVYPNPTANELTVDLSQLSKGHYELFLVDLNGKIIYKKNETSQIEHINMSSSPNGTYSLIIQGVNTKKIETHKIIKNN